MVCRQGCCGPCLYCTLPLEGPHGRLALAVKPIVSEPTPFTNWQAMSCGRTMRLNSHVGAPHAPFGHFPYPTPTSCGLTPCAPPP